MEVHLDIVAKLPKVGDYVKVKHNHERFWLQVLSVENDRYKGRVDNELVEDHPFEYNDIIGFSLENIIETETE